VIGHTLTTTPVTPAGQRSLLLRPASGVKIRPVRWAWTGRIPAGSITLIPGREGIGKSLLLAWLTARITRGELPGVHFGTPRAVIYAASEDSWSYTIAPRLLAAGADLGLVFRIDVLTESGTGFLTLPKDTSELAKLITGAGVVLFAADPLLSLVDSGINTNSEGVRDALEPLAKLADRTHCAVVGLAHFNKKDSTDANNLITGSRAFSAVARAVLAVARDTSADDGSCVLSQTKANLGTLNVPSLRYIIESAELPTDEGPAEVGKLVFTGESDRSVADILGDSSSEPGEADEKNHAVAWLVSFLIAQGGEASRADLVNAARKEGIAIRTLQRHHRKARVTIVSEGFPRTNMWRLDAGNSPSPGNGQNGSRASGAERGNLGATGATGATAHGQSPTFDLPGTAEAPAQLWTEARA
jgi:hypothetical protein